MKKTILISILAGLMFGAVADECNMTLVKTVIASHDKEVLISIVDGKSTEMDAVKSKKAYWLTQGAEVCVVDSAVGDKIGMKVRPLASKKAVWIPKYDSGDWVGEVPKHLGSL